MTNWDKLISTNKNAVLDFATNKLNSSEFQREFSGKPNPARNVVRTYGTTYARRLARKALRRRNVLV